MVSTSVYKDWFAMENKKTVSLCMIVKDEAWILEKCLASVTGIVDEILIGDTGSTDNSKEIAAKFGAFVFDVPWEEDFSKARNHILKKASCDWILLLDADEIFNSEDTDTFLHLLTNENYDGYHFTLLNYYDDENTKEYSVHYAFRLLRNTGEYHFEGRIHEQIQKEGGTLDPSRFTLAEVTLFHYGYTVKAIENKQKHKRNMPLLKKQLEDNPADPYYLFNIANEYMAEGDITEALDYYLKSYEKKVTTQAYFPHIFYRIILCYMSLKDSKKALAFALEGLSYYPECTDFEYLRGSIYQNNHKHLLAIASFKRCLAMGEAPTIFRFTGGCGTYKAYQTLGDIYTLEEMYEEAVEAYVNSLHYKECPGCTISLGKALCKLCSDSYTLFDQLIIYLPYADYGEKLLHAIHILIEERYYKRANVILEKTHLSENWKGDYLLLSGKLSFYQHDYKKAYHSLLELMTEKNSLSALTCYKEEISAFFFLTLIQYNSLYSNNQSYDSYYHYLEGLSMDKRNTCKLIAGRLAPELFQIGNTDVLDYNFFFLVFEILLKSEGKAAVSRLTAVVPKLFILDAYTKLGEIYAKCGYCEEAVTSILQSIKEYSYIDKESAWYLGACL